MGEFEHDIDEAAGTKRWTFLDEGTLEKLLRSGWSALCLKAQRYFIKPLSKTIARSLGPTDPDGGEIRTAPPTTDCHRSILLARVHAVNLLVKERR